MCIHVAMLICDTVFDDATLFEVEVWWKEAIFITGRYTYRDTHNITNICKYDLVTNFVHYYIKNPIMGGGPPVIRIFYESVLCSLLPEIDRQCGGFQYTTFDVTHVWYGFAIIRSSQNRVLTEILPVPRKP